MSNHLSNFFYLNKFISIKFIIYRTIILQFLRSLYFNIIILLKIAISEFII